LPEQLKQNLSKLKQDSGISCLNRISHGLEKESLRVNTDGHIASTPHPAGLGSALTHSCITTDFSEALMEFITPVFQQPKDSLSCLADIHGFTYSQLARDELLWTSSMPCIVGRDEDIPLAEYGSSNIGRLKTLYRRGLGYRYGRTMQTISGIHYNFSLPEQFWLHYHKQNNSSDDLQPFITRQYFGLIRNFRRYSWLLLYLYGASPALCKSFVRHNQNHGLESYDDHSLYAPYATSLRMGDLGYTSKAQSDLYISYNSLGEYADGLLRAIKTPYPPYSRFVTPDGLPAQINDSVLQIENEFYSTIRPKRIARSGLRPVHALREQGVEYIEVRCLDLNPFMTVGIDEQQINFLNGFLLFCLLRASPPSDRTEYHEIDANLKAVVRRGRDPKLQLQRNGKSVSLSDWANEILVEVMDIAGLLDEIHGSKAHTLATAAEMAKVGNPALTPSARVLQRMNELDTSYFRFAMEQSLGNSDYFRNRPLDPEIREQFEKMSAVSNLERETIEASDTVDFNTFVDQLNAS
jgi:glutamate--cysteine ligase